MRRTVTLLLLVLTSVFLQAQDTLAKPAPQDTLVLRNSTRIASKILEINPETVRYKKAENPDGPDYTTNKSEIRYIIFKSGIKETMDTLRNAPKATANPAPGMSNADMYRKGTADAALFYNRPCGAVGTGVASFAIGIFGLIPAVIISATPPKEQNLGYPSRELWKNKDYQSGYKYKAKKMKQKKVWTGFGIGLAASFIFILLLSQ
jgi:hypothetical protein